jgi:hypothetical protein
VVIGLITPGVVHGQAGFPVATRVAFCRDVLLGRFGVALVASAEPIVPNEVGMLLSRATKLGIIHKGRVDKVLGKLVSGKWITDVAPRVRGVRPGGERIVDRGRASSTCRSTRCWNMFTAGLARRNWRPSTPSGDGRHLPRFVASTTKCL